MSGNIMNGQKQASRNERYTYAMFYAPGVAFKAKAGAIDANFASMTATTNSSDMKLSPDPAASAGGFSGFVSSEEPKLMWVSLMYPWGYSRYWVDSEANGYRSVFASFTAFDGIDHIFVEGEIVYFASSVEKILAVSLVSLQLNPEDPANPTRDFVRFLTVPLAGYNHPSDGRWISFPDPHTLTCKVVDVKTKEVKVLWTKPRNVVGGWGYSMVSISPDASKAVTVALFEGSATVWSIVEISMAGGEITQVKEGGNYTFTYTDNGEETSWSATEAYSTVSFFCSCCTPPDWSTGIAFQQNTMSQDSSASGAGVLSGGGPFYYACQYDYDGTILELKGTVSASRSYTQSKHTEYDTNYTYEDWRCDSIPGGTAVVADLTWQRTNAHSRTTQHAQDLKEEVDFWGNTVITKMYTKRDTTSSTGTGVGTSINLALGFHGTTNTGEITAVQPWDYKQDFVGVSIVALDLRHKFAVLVEHTGHQYYTGTSTVTMDLSNDTGSVHNVGDFAQGFGGRVHIIRDNDVEVLVGPDDPANSSPVDTTYTWEGTNWEYSELFLPTQPTAGSNSSTSGSNSVPPLPPSTIPNWTPEAASVGFYLGRMLNHNFCPQEPTSSPSIMSSQVHCVGMNGVALCSTPLWPGNSGWYYSMSWQNLPGWYSKYQTPPYQIKASAYAVKDVGEVPATEVALGVDRELNAPVSSFTNVHSVRPV